MSYIDIQRNDGNIVIVYATSCLNPLSNLNQLSEELARNLHEPCSILFDLLLSNGDSYNRFVKCEFDGKKIINSSVDIVNEDGLDMNYKACIVNHYKRVSKNNYMNSALSQHDIGKIIRKYQQQV